MLNSQISTSCSCALIAFASVTAMLTPLIVAVSFLSIHTTSPSTLTPQAISSSVSTSDTSTIVISCCTPSIVLVIVWSCVNQITVSPAVKVNSDTSKSVPAVPVNSISVIV